MHMKLMKNSTLSLLWHY